MFFEEFALGQVFETKQYLMTDEEVATFAAAYDPQPIHVGSVPAGTGLFGGAIASGFHTMCVAWRLWVDAFVEGHGEAGISLTDARFRRPVYPGTNIQAKVTIEEARVTSRGHGLITMAFEVLDDQAEVVLTFRTTGMIMRRAAACRAS
jgi:acyl dehydratase